MATQRTLSPSRRTQILQAAVETISERGLCDARIADIAARAGTSAALLIYYFGRKDRLLADALAYSEEQFYAQTERELASLPTAGERLSRLVELSCSVGAAGRTPMLIANRRVTSPTVRVPNPRYRHARRAVSSRSDQRGEPSLGGVRHRSGPSTSASPPIHASHLAMASASFRENFATSSWFRLASST